MPFQRQNGKLPCVGFSTREVAVLRPIVWLFRFVWLLLFRPSVVEQLWIMNKAVHELAFRRERVGEETSLSSWCMEIRVSQVKRIAPFSNTQYEILFRPRRWPEFPFVMRLQTPTHERYRIVYWSILRGGLCLMRRTDLADEIDQAIPTEELTQVGHLLEAIDEILAEKPARKLTAV